MARAICSLDSVSRWAVTGTPIQNRLGDLATLLKFLKVYPYSEKRVFEADISYVWKSGNPSEAIKRLKRLSGCLLLRRPKGIIQLPPRRDLQCPIDFTQAERRLYDEIRAQAIARIDEALLHNVDSTRSNCFVNVLQQIEALRMVCNLGLYYPSRHEACKDEGKTLNTDNWSLMAQRAFNLQRGIGQIQCHSCSSAVETVEILLGDPTEQREPRFSRCLRFICSACVQRLTSVDGMIGCGHDPPCLVAPISTNTSSLEEPSVPMLPGSGLGGGLWGGLPTKVAVLLEDLRKLPGDVKWYVDFIQTACQVYFMLVDEANQTSVIFSTWRMTLDVVEAGLKQALIPSHRFDGKVPQKDRQGVIERFRKDSSIRVLLLTLSCGAVG